MDSNAVTIKGPEITAKSWVIASGATGYVIEGKKERIRREIASLTKMMTCYVVCTYCRKMRIDPKKLYTRVSKESTLIDGTTAYLKEGDTPAVWDLLHGLMLPSGNDAAWALAENIGKLMLSDIKRNIDLGSCQEIDGSKLSDDPVKMFIREMNRKAGDLRLWETCFANPHGLANNFNKSTASDLAKLCSKVLADDWISKIVRTKEYRCRINNDLNASREVYWENTNKLLIEENFDGIKTGITPSAGPCLASSYRNERAHIIIILLNSRSMEDRWIETKGLVDYALNNLVPKSGSK